jgi:hypothetical protein
MLRSGLEDHMYNNQVALAKLGALCMDALKATCAIPIWPSKNYKYYVHIVLKMLQAPSLDSPQKPTGKISR